MVEKAAFVRDTIEMCKMCFLREFCLLAPATELNQNEREEDQNERKHR